MFSRFKFWKEIAKDLFIEAASAGIASVSYVFLSDPDNPNDLLSSALSLRIYYFSKNILNAIDARFNKLDSARHVYAGGFNAGVGLTLYPAIKFVGKMSVQERIATAAIVCAGGVVLRGMIEMKSEDQSIKDFSRHHRGSLIGGASGIFFSAWSPAGVASPSCYWSGALVDVLRGRPASQKLIDGVLSVKATVPLQVLGAYFFKLSTTLSKHTLPFPGYVIDSLFGYCHRVIVHARSHRMMGIVVPEMKEVKVQPPPIEHSVSALVQLMSRGNTTVFRQESTGVQNQNVPISDGPALTSPR